MGGGLCHTPFRTRTGDWAEWGGCSSASLFRKGTSPGNASRSGFTLGFLTVCFLKSFSSFFENFSSFPVRFLQQIHIGQAEYQKVFSLPHACSRHHQVLFDQSSMKLPGCFIQGKGLTNHQYQHLLSFWTLVSNLMFACSPDRYNFSCKRSDLKEMMIEYRNRELPAWRHKPEKSTPIRSF